MSTWQAILNESIEIEFRDSPAFCSLATVDDYGKPTVRSMVCREIGKEGQLVFVSDRRSRKDDHLRDRPACEVCFWLSRAGKQIRVAGEATVVDADSDQFMLQQWWDKLPEDSRIHFMDSDGKETLDMPMTFELIVVYPQNVEILDINTHPPTTTRWTESNGVWIV